MNKTQFSYRKGQCEFIDWLCKSNKLIILSDVSENPEISFATNSLSIIEEMLEYPSQDILLLRSDYNISSFAFRRLMENFGNISFGNKRKSKDFNIIYYLESKKALYCSPYLIIPWQTLHEALKEFNNLAYLIPSI